MTKKLTQFAAKVADILKSPFRKMQIPGRLEGVFAWLTRVRILGWVPGYIRLSKHVSPGGFSDYDGEYEYNDAIDGAIITCLYGWFESGSGQGVIDQLRRRIRADEAEISGINELLQLYVWFKLHRAQLRAELDAMADESSFDNWEVYLQDIRRIAKAQNLLGEVRDNFQTLMLEAGSTSEGFRWAVQDPAYDSLRIESKCLRVVQLKEFMY